MAIAFSTSLDESFGLADLRFPNQELSPGTRLFESNDSNYSERRDDTGTHGAS